jgi:U1 small nuclear ribonucleoprotein C
MAVEDGSMMELSFFDLDTVVTVLAHYIINNHYVIFTLVIMPRYYCDYCDAYLTHDSASVRKQHNSGFKHKSNFKAYYLQFEEEAQMRLFAEIHGGVAPAPGLPRGGVAPAPGGSVPAQRPYGGSAPPPHMPMHYSGGGGGALPPQQQQYQQQYQHGGGYRGGGHRPQRY